MGGDKHDATYYIKCMIGGVLACGLTHTAVVPLDVVKCRRQANPQFAKSLGDGFGKIKSQGSVYLGWGPTLIGYSLQGFGKFGFYQIFKDVYKSIVGQQNADRYKKVGWSIASGSAQIIADLLLCPWEAAKLKIQTKNKGQYPSGIVSSISKLMADQGVSGMYRGIVPLWSRQVPYTIVKFVAFQAIVQMFYDNIFTKGKQNYSKGTQLSVTFMSGYLAGIFCAVVSHPADTMVSKIYSSKDISNKSIGQAVSQIYAKIGFKGLWAGLMTRILMVGTLTGLQWWIYDTFKTAVGLQTTGGGSKKVQAVK